MKTLYGNTVNLIRNELESIPEEYKANLNSIHEGYGVLMEEVKELEDEIFFGKKRAAKEVEKDLSREYRDRYTSTTHKERMRNEAVQVAAMAIRFIQELT